MRVFIMDKAMDLQSLAASLARNARTAEATLERVKALNPQIADAQGLAAGTVLILPDSPELKPGLGAPAGAATHTLSDLANQVRAGLRDMEARNRQMLEQRAMDHAAVREALKAAPARRLVDSDPVLKERLASAEAAFKTEQKRAAEMDAQFAEIARLAEAELAKLQRLFS